MGMVKRALSAVEKFEIALNELIDRRFREDDKMKYKIKTEVVEAYQYFEKHQYDAPVWFREEVGKRKSYWGVNPKYYTPNQSYKLWAKEEDNWVLVHDGDYFVLNGEQMEHFRKEEFESKYEKYDKDNGTPTEKANKEKPNMKQARNIKRGDVFKYVGKEWVATSDYESYDVDGRIMAVTTDVYGSNKEQWERNSYVVLPGDELVCVPKFLSIEDLTLAQKKVARDGYCGQFNMPRGSGKSTACFVGAVDRCLDEIKPPVRVAIFCNNICVYKSMVENLVKCRDAKVLNFDGGWLLTFTRTGSTLTISKHIAGKRLMCANGKYAEPKYLRFEYDDVYFDEFNLVNIQYLFESKKSVADILSNFAKNKWVIVNTSDSIYTPLNR